MKGYIIYNEEEAKKIAVLLKSSRMKAQSMILVSNMFHMKSTEGMKNLTW